MSYQGNNPEGISGSDSQPGSRYRIQRRKGSCESKETSYQGA